MPDPKDGIHLEGKLNEIRWDGDDVHAMDWIYDRAAKDTKWVGSLDPDAKIGEVTGLRHFTRDGWAVFFRWSNVPPEMFVYAIGRHPGDDLRQYRLHTFETGTKTKLYEF
jgi:hypothetical protein